MKEIKQTNFKRELFSEQIKLLRNSIDLCDNLNVTYKFGEKKAINNAYYDFARVEFATDELSINLYKQVKLVGHEELIYSLKVNPQDIKKLSMLGKLRNSKTFDMVIEPGDIHTIPYRIYNENCRYVLSDTKLTKLMPSEFTNCVGLNLFSNQIPILKSIMEQYLNCINTEDITKSKTFNAAMKILTLRIIQDLDYFMDIINIGKESNGDVFIIDLHLLEIQYLLHQINIVKNYNRRKKSILAIETNALGTYLDTKLYPIYQSNEKKICEILDTARLGNIFNDLWCDTFKIPKNECLNVSCEN